MKKFVLAAVAATIAVPAAAAPDQATDQGTASATIVAPISITHDTGAELSFGTIISPTANSTVTVTSGSANVTSGDAVWLSGGSSDSFTVEGEDGRSFSITTTGGTMGGMSFMTSAPASGTISGASATFSVDGVLSIPANQAAGDYTGSYDATVTYL